MSIKTLLSDEIKDELEGLHGLGLGTEEYKVTVDGVTKLMDRFNEMEKIQIESLERAESRDTETDLKLRELADEKHDRFVKNCLTGVSIITGIGVAVWGTLVSQRFEKEDSYTSITGRGWVNKTISFLKK